MGGDLNRRRFVGMIGVAGSVALIGTLQDEEVEGGSEVGWGSGEWGAAGWGG